MGFVTRMIARRVGLVALLLAAARGGAQEAPARAVDTLRVRVHDHDIVMYRSGSGAGPVVVLEAGGGSSYASWGTLTSQLATFARVVGYDRPGFGLSEPCSRPRHAESVAGELREALGAAGIASPYLLVGWSLSGAYIRVYAGLYPDDVAGLVLLDPAPEDFYARAERADSATYHSELRERNARVARSGPGYRAESAMFDSSMALARRSDASLRAPVALLTAAEPNDAMQSIWIDDHRRWAARTPRVRHAIVERSRHAIHRDRPDVVLETIRATLR